MIPLHPRGCVVSLPLPCLPVLSVTRSFCLSQIAPHADTTVIFIVIIALNLRADLRKGSGAKHNSSMSRRIRTSAMPLAEDYKSHRTVFF